MSVWLHAPWRRILKGVMVDMLGRRLLAGLIIAAESTVKRPR